MLPYVGSSLKSDWRQMAWSPDRRYLFFTNGHAELWEVPIAGGAPRQLAGNLPLINGISVHPDGRRIAISHGSGKAEVWVMENLLAATSSTGGPTKSTTAAR